MFANYTSCCRLCLADKVASLNSIYAGYSDADTLVEKINALIGVQITSQDKLTTMLCEKCYRNVNNWDGFRKRCLQNQDKLQEWMNNSTEAPVVQIKEEPIDVDEHDEAVVPMDEPQDDDIATVKPEPADTVETIEDYPDLPPALSPNPPALTREVVEEEETNSQEDEQINSQRPDVALENYTEHMIQINLKNIRVINSENRFNMPYTNSDKNHNGNSASAETPYPSKIALKEHSYISNINLDVSSRDNLETFKNNTRETIKNTLRDNPENIKILRAHTNMHNIVPESNPAILNYTALSRFSKRSETSRFYLENNGTITPNNSDLPRFPLEQKPKIILIDDSDSEEKKPRLSEKTIPKIILQSNVEIKPSQTKLKSLAEIALEKNLETNLNQINGNAEWKNPLACMVCDRIFSNISNKKKHERTMHGPYGGGGDLKNRTSLRNMYIKEVVEAESENSQQSEKTQSSNISEIEQEKITFAAGLRLQSKSATPTPTITQNNVKSTDLTKVEWNYLERNRIMLTMFKRTTCCCHNQHYGTWKKLLMHLRQLYTWFTPFTCYNCLVIFPGRSGKMRHHLRCPKGEYEYLGRLSESRVRTEEKIRLYQNFKCMQCNMIYYFFEEFCEHISYEHIGDQESYKCKCDKVFDNKEEFSKHVYKSCYVKYYCDVCFTTFSELSEFKRHCEDSHDKDVNFEFFMKHPGFSVYDGETVKRILSTNGKPAVAPPSLKPATKDDDIKVINPLALAAHHNCKLCDHSATSYNNLLKHIRSYHKSEIPEEVDRGVCDVCGIKFSTFHNMLRHRKVHNEEMKQLKCPECPEKFRLNIELKEHLSTIHSTGRPVRLIHRCTECGESFKNIPLLEEHKKTHAQKCEECGKEFYSNKEYEQHRNSHLTLTLKRDPHTMNYSSLSPGTKMCQLCERQFEKEEELQAHMKLHETMPTLEAENDSMMKTYTCIECDKVYTNSKSLWAHNRRFHPGVTSTNKGFPRTCDECGRTITTHPAWLMHQQMHKRNSLKVESLKGNSDNSREDSDYHTCKRCFKVFANRSNLKNHMKSHGINVSPSRALAKTKQQKTYWCDACHTACHGIAELNKHKSECNVSEADSETKSTDTTEEAANKKPRKNFTFALNPQEELNRKPVYCKYCKIPFTSPVSLAQHMQREHDEKPKPTVVRNISINKYSCVVCKKSFTTAGALNTHQGWHKRSKTSKLQIKNEFNEQAVFEEQHKCKTCGSSFDDDTTLQLHILEVHRNINTSVLSAPKCRQCDLEFKTRAELDHHEKTFHQPMKFKKAYQTVDLNKIGVSCKYCNKIFSRSDYLNLHINKKHPEYSTAGPFKCTQCNRVFDKQNALSIHLKVHEKLNTNSTVSPPAASNANKVYKYSCSICHAGYDLPKDLRNHIITSHPF